MKRTIHNVCCPSIKIVTNKCRPVYIGSLQILSKRTTVQLPKVETTILQGSEFPNIRGILVDAGHQLTRGIIEEAPALTEPQEVMTQPRPLPLRHI